MKSLLNVSGLEVSRDGRKILAVEQLDVRDGEVLSVIGPNGAGKSTLLLAIAGLLEYQTGKIIFQGQEIPPRDNLSYRRRIGLVMQAPLLLDQTVFDNVAAGLRFRRTGREQIDLLVRTWLERLDITHLSRRRARKLSGGEAQRVSLARAFALQPELLLLDEPFSALDAPTRARMLADVQSLLAETGIAAVFITHDLDEALLLGDRMAVLIGGQLRQLDTPEQVYSAPADTDVAAFVGVETVMPGIVRSQEEGRLLVQVHKWTLEAIGELVPGREVLYCVRPEDVTLWKDGEHPQSSARNRLHGRIRKIIPQGVLVRVEVDCGMTLIALVTRTSVQEMGLAEGVSVTATFKASAVHLIPK